MVGTVDRVFHILVTFYTFLLGLAIALKIDLVAVGCNDPPARGRCGASYGSIKINGIEKSTNGRGLNLVALTYPQGKFFRRANFDVYGDGRASARMLQWVKALSNKIVLIASRDAIDSGNFKREAFTALVSLLVLNTVQLVIFETIAFSTCVFFSHHLYFHVCLVFLIASILSLLLPFDSFL